MRFRKHEKAATRATHRLLLQFALVVVGLVLAVNAVLALVWWLVVPFASALPQHFIATNTFLVLLYVVGGCAVETSRLADGGAHVARMAGAREAQPGRGSELGRLEQRFVNVVQEMAIASGQQPAPAAWVLARDDAINAFAAGWGADDSVVAVSRGALERLTRAELQGVVAHECSHLVHGDGPLNMRLVGMVWGLQLIWNLGQALMAPDDVGRRGALFPVGVALLCVGSLGWLAGRVLQAAVSRQREFLADASAVKYTRDIEGLGGALRKLADQQRVGRARLASIEAESLSHLFFAPTGWFGHSHPLLATHPPLAERIARIYGHEVDPIEARVLPAPAEDEPLHPALMALLTGRAPAVIGAAVPVQAEAFENDALQRPDHFDAAAREAEALARIGRWYGPGEWQAAMLALSLPAFAPDDDLAIWHAATADLGVAEAVRTEIAALRAPARRRVFVQLIERASGWSATLRIARCRELLQTRWSRWPSGSGRHWQAFVLHRCLHGPHPAAPHRAPADGLAVHAAACHAATVMLTPALGLPPELATAWQRAALQELARLSPAPPRGPGAGLAPATPVPTLRLALRVRRLSPMQRPQLLWAWLQATQATGALAHASAVDALHLACVVLDLPVPEALGA